MLRVIVWVLMLAAVLYLIYWTIDRRADVEPRRRPRHPTPSGPRGPDDDDDFLRELDRRRDDDG